MHVGFDLVFLSPGASGGRETYARELLGALRAADGSLRITCLVNRETAAAGPGFWSSHADSVVVLPRASGVDRARWALAELAAVPRAAARAGVDVLHAPANFAPMSGPFARVVTLHDLLHREHPELIPAGVRLATRALLEPAARRAHRVITVSRASADAITRELRLPEERVAVVPNGLGAVRPGDGAAALARLGAGSRPVVLSVASHLPHKNLDGLLAGLAAMEPRPLLVIAGHGTAALADPARALGVSDDVRLLGSVSAHELEDLYAAASALATTTLAEGFGLPVLEAMARGVPVACSDLPVLREVAGDCAAYLDPRSPSSIAGAVRAALAADGSAGRARAARFSWDSAAAQTLAVYRAAVTAARTAAG